LFADPRYSGNNLLLRVALKIVEADSHRRDSSTLLCTGATPNGANVIINAGSETPQYPGQAFAKFWYHGLRQIANVDDSLEARSALRIRIRIEGYGFGQSP
jgi:hypothetical protein